MNTKVPKFIKNTEYRIWETVGTGQLRRGVLNELNLGVITREKNDIRLQMQCHCSDMRDLTI